MFLSEKELFLYFFLFLLLFKEIGVEGVAWYNVWRKLVYAMCDSCMTKERVVVNFPNF